jgi:ribosome-associated translation inhibitor RaiA
MRLETHIKGFEKTEALDQLIQDAANGLTSDLLRNDRDVHVIVTGDEDRHRNQSRKPHFFCEVQVKSASSKKWFKTVKASENFHTALIDAFHAMRTVLQKRSDRRHDLKVAATMPEALDLSAPPQNDSQQMDTSNWETAR